MDAKKVRAGECMVLLFLLRGSRAANSINSIELSTFHGRIGKTGSLAGRASRQLAEIRLLFALQIGKICTAALPYSGHSSPRRLRKSIR
jgi:hypothetical protein